MNINQLFTNTFTNSNSSTNTYTHSNTFTITSTNTNTHTNIPLMERQLCKSFANYDCHKLFYKVALFRWISFSK